MAGLSSANLSSASQAVLVDDGQILEILPIKPSISGQQAIGDRLGMGADQKIGHDAITFSAHQCGSVNRENSPTATIRDRSVPD